MRATACFLLAFVAACASPDIEIKTTPTPGADFGQLKTYAWKARKPSGDKKLDDEFLGDAVEDSVDKHLASRGFTKVASKPDFELGHLIVLSRETVVEEGGSDIYGEDSYGPARGRAPNETEVKEYKIGTLIVDAFEPGGTRRLWRGWAKAQLYINPSPSHTERRIREACQRMFKRFPR
ncbi:MAG: DUF4136 domain-containing protein [Planctomycetota bacterium]